jgi:hypothetical protein
MYSDTDTQALPVAEVLRAYALQGTDDAVKEQVAVNYIRRSVGCMC